MLFPLGVLLDIQFVYHRIRYGAATRLRIDDVSWGYLDIFIVITVFILALFSLAVLYPGISKMFPPGEKTLLPVVFHFIAELVALAFLFRLLSVRCHRIARPLKLIPYELVDQILFGIRCYIGFLPLLLILNWLTEWIANLWGIKLLPQEQIGLFFADASLPLLVFFTAFVAFFGPLIEELFFRGFTYQALRIKFGKWTSILVTATLFSLLHTNLAAFIPILGLGILLAYAFEWSGSLIPSIVIHICHNSVSVAVVLLIRSL
jgi:membrane protease YdiL (CAAX protease family)